MYSSTSNSFSAGTGQTITPTSVVGLPTDTEITLTFYRLNSSGTTTPAAMERIIGTITGSNFVTRTSPATGRGADGTTDAAHTSPVVEMVWNAKDWNDAVDWALVEHTQAGAHKGLTASTVTASLITASQITACNISGPSKFPKVSGMYDAGNSGSAITINWLNGDRQKTAITASTTISFSNPADGQALTLLMKSAASGVFSITLPTMKWTGSAATTMGTTSGCNNTITALYDATGSQYFAKAGASYG